MNRKDFFQDSDYLQNDQYRDSSNLDARAELHRRYSSNKYGWHEWVFDHVVASSGNVVLECGCGPGWLWRNNLARIPEGFSITLGDLSQGMVDEAQQALQETRHGFRFETVNIESLPFDEASFDVVVANHMLYHVPNRERAFAEVQRVLRPGGRFIAATNGNDHMIELRQLGQGLLEDKQAKDVPLHLQSIASSSFGLENGRSQLDPWFSDVTLHYYEDSLAVTEVEPLIAYISSSSASRAFLTAELLSKITAHIEGIITKEGAFHITKSSGIFVARRD